MRLNLILLFGFIAATLGLTYFLTRPSPHEVKNVPVETINDIKDYPDAPVFTFTNLNGKQINLETFRGKTILLNFWASWCAPCAIEFPQMLNLLRQHPQEFILLAISVDADKNNIPKFFETIKEPLPDNNHPDIYIGWDPDKKISQDLFQTIRYPETYVIGPDLTLRQKIIGASIDFDSDEFYQNLKKISSSFE